MENEEQDNDSPYFNRTVFGDCCHLLYPQLVHRGGIENTTENYFGSYVRENDILKFKIMEPSWFEFKPDLSVFKLKMNEEYTFYIEKLTSSKMILTRGEDERFVFRKF